MAWWGRKKVARPADLIASETLAEYGRFAFLGPDAYDGPLDREHSSWEVISPVVVALSTPASRFRALAELRRHGADGEWQRVGAWQVVKEHDGVDYGADAIDVVESGFRALLAMRVTNIAHWIAFGERDLWLRLIGSPPPDDFAGPPVFDSVFGHSKKFYFDQIVAASARPIARLPEAVGVSPGELREAIQSVWSFALLLYRGASRVHVDLRSEADVVSPAIAVASSSDHILLMDDLAETILRGDPFYREWPWAALGAARFAEEYLQPHAVAGPSYGLLLDAGLTGLVERGLIDNDLPLDVLTPRQRERLSEIGTA